MVKVRSHCIIATRDLLCMSSQNNKNINKYFTIVSQWYLKAFGSVHVMQSIHSHSQILKRVWI